MPKHPVLIRELYALLVEVERRTGLTPHIVDDPTPHWRIGAVALWQVRSPLDGQIIWQAVRNGYLHEARREDWPLRAQDRPKVLVGLIDWIVEQLKGP